MAREIVCNNSAEEPGKHSRLWVSRDICDVLNMIKGTKAIEGIIHNYSEYKDGSKELSFPTETFKRMSKLRFLHLDRVNLTGSFEQTLENLRWLCWDWCPLKFLPSDFYLQKLVILEFPHSKIRTMWELNKGSQVFENLKTLNMSYSLDLTATPDFSMLPSLKTLQLEGCKSLEEVHISIGSLRGLVSLALAYCSNLRSLPASICTLRALKILNIGNCSSLRALPIELNIESLEELNAEGLTVCNLPDSIGRLSKLVELNLRYCQNLKTLPESICNLRALEILSIADCSSIKGLPIKLGNIESLKNLNAEGLIVWTIPDSIGHLSKLVELRLSYSKNLKTLPDTICKLRLLEILCIGGYCSSLKALPIQLGNMVSLKELNAEGLTVRTLPDSVGLLSKLVVLRLSYNRNLEILPNTICNLRALKVLSIDYCSGLKAMPTELGNIESLNELNAWGITVSKLPDSIERLCNLKIRYHNELLESVSRFRTFKIFKELQRL